MKRSLRALIAAVMTLGIAGPPRAVSADLHQQAKAIAAKELQRCGKGYVARIDAARHIIYVSALDDKHFQETADLLTAFTDAHRRTILKRPLQWNLTIVLPTAEDYPRLAAEPKTRGLYYYARHKLIAVDRGRVLLHEFTHALHHADAAAERQKHPLWVTEGLATLFQACRITPSGLEPIIEASLLIVQRAIRDKKSIPLATLFKMGRKAFMAEAAICYAESRYALLYLVEKGRLKHWYKRFKSGYADDPTGRKAYEAALNNRLHIIEDEWKRWVGSLKVPKAERRAGQARLGVEVADDPRGVRVVGLVPGGAGKRAGRIRVGDIITKFNGHKVANPAVFVALVRRAGAMRTVRIEIIRHGRPQQIRQPLGAARPAVPSGKHK